MRASRFCVLASVGIVSLAGLLTGLSACNRGQSSSGGGASASAERTPAPDGAVAAESGAPRGDGGGRSYAHRDDGGYRSDRPPVPMFHGEPMWSENRNHTAQENAEYHFERAGADLGTKTLDAFLTKVHHFCDEPPAGTLSLTRANGDRLLFDPKSGIFAVVTRDGAPRTVFKPSDGMAYWNEQKARETAEAGDDNGGGRRSYRRRDEGRDYGGRDRGERYDRGRSSDHYGDNG